MKLVTFIYNEKKYLGLWQDSRIIALSQAARLMGLTLGAEKPSRLEDSPNAAAAGRSPGRGQTPVPPRWRRQNNENGGRGKGGFNPELAPQVPTSNSLLTSHLSPLLSGPDCLESMEALLTADEAGRHLVQRIAAGYPPETVVPAEEVQLAAPLTRPPKIICIGMNYRSHCAEQGAKLPSHPIIFAKFATAITGPGSPVIRPRLTRQLDYEAELAVVIGRRGKNIGQHQAMEYVAGYTIFNDVSARDIQFGDRQWVRGKTFDTFAPMGPWLVTGDEIPDPQDLRLRCWVNGELRQDSTTAEMIFPVPYLIEFLSQVVTLEPGDIIATGTPAGVGAFRQPPVFLEPGDRIRMEIAGLGGLENSIVDAEYDN